MFKKRIHKLRKSFLKRFLFLIRKQQFEFVYKQIKFQLDLRDSIDREIFFNGYYEENQIQFLIDSIKKHNIKHMYTAHSMTLYQEDIIHDAKKKNLEFI